MEEEILKVVLASFVSGVTGAMMGTFASVFAMRVEIRWLREQLELAHQRITKVNDKIDKLVTSLRRRVDETRDYVLKNIP